MDFASQNGENICGIKLNAVETCSPSLPLSACSMEAQLYSYVCKRDVEMENG